MVYVGDRDKGKGVDFTSKVGKHNDGSSWFPAKAKGSSLPPGVAAIATVTPGSKSSGTWVTLEEAKKALGIKEDEWEDMMKEEDEFFGKGQTD